MAVKIEEVKHVKEGKYMMMDGEPCKINSITVSAPGKHGHAKARITGVGVFDNRKRNFLGNMHQNIEVPILDKKNGQVVAMSGSTSVQLMDLETYETFDIDVPEEFQGKLSAGTEVAYVDFEGQKLITRSTKAD